MNQKSGKKICLSILGILFLVTQLNWGCTIVAAGRKATVDGSVIVSHTDGGAESRIHVVPAMRFRKGAQAPVYWGIQNGKSALRDYGEIIGYIPQVERTYAYIHSGIPHINEHQLAIGESTSAQRKALRVSRDKGAKQIMTVEQAMVFALQRCKTAKGAVKLITTLTETYGFLPSCGEGSEILAIADTREVWVLELLSVGYAWEPGCGKPGVIWAAQRLPDDHVTMVPNFSVIKEIDLSRPEAFMASENYMREAVDRGWYDPQSGKPFVWQEVYAPLTAEYAIGRFWLFYSRQAPSLREWPRRSLSNPYKSYDNYHAAFEPLSIYPTSVKPEKKISLQDVMAFQRSVFEGTIYDMTSDVDWLVPDHAGNLKKSPLTTPFPTRDMRELLDINWRRNVSRGGYGMIAQLRDWLPDGLGGIYWFYLDNQYTSTYVPIYCGVREISPLYNTYDPDRYSDDSARWAIDFVDNLLYLKWQEAIQDLWKVRDAMEKKFFDEQAAVDEKAAAMYKKSPHKAREYLTLLTKKRMAEVVEMYRDLRNLLISKYTNNKQGSGMDG